MPSPGAGVPSGGAVEQPIWQAVAVFRWAALVYAVVTFARVAEEVRRPALGWAVLAAMGLWTLVVSRRFVRRPGRTWGWVAADLVAAAAALLATRLVDTAERIEQGAQTLPVVWPAAAVLAAAVLGGPWVGLAAASAVGAVGLVERGTLATTTAHNVVLLLFVGVIVGYGVTLARRAESAVAQARAAAAATRERERLARAVHDGVLQVLAYVQRRGAELGGDAAELGRLAGEQEVALRALVASAGAPPAPGRLTGAPAATSVDLRDLLRRHASVAVTVSTPADPVLLPGDEAAELDLAVAAALDNVARHATGSRCWVLLEEEPAEVVVSVRDDGPGFADGRLEQAEAAGRLGVAQSIRARVRELGGHVDIWSSPGAGTEVEIRLPRRAVRLAGGR